MPYTQLNQAQALSLILFSLVFASVLGWTLVRGSSFYRALYSAKTHSPQFSPTLEGLRGLLCISIFGYHTIISYYFWHTHHWGDPNELPAAVKIGSASVVLYFFLTGYLFWNRKLTETNVQPFLKFYLARLRRIGPGYVLIVGVNIFLAFSSAGFKLFQPINRVLINILYWLAFGLFALPPFNRNAETRLLNAGMLWTIRIEVVYYLLLPFLDWFARGWRIIYFIALAGILYAVGRNQHFEGAFETLLVETLKFSLVGFAFGMMAAKLSKFEKIRRVMGQRSAAICSCILALSLLVILPEDYSVGESMLLFPLFLSIVVENRFWKFLASRAALSLGTISYSVYLLHGAVLYVGKAALFSLGFTVDSGGALFIFTAGATIIVVGLSAITYRFIESPFMAKSRAQLGLTTG